MCTRCRHKMGDCILDLTLYYLYKLVLICTSDNHMPPTLMEKKQLAYPMHLLQISLLTSEIENGLAVHLSIESKTSCFYHKPSLPPLTNVGGSGKASDNISQVNIAFQGEGSFCFPKSDKVCQHFFHDCSSTTGQNVDSTRCNLSVHLKIKGEIPCFPKYGFIGEYGEQQMQVLSVSAKLAISPAISACIHNDDKLPFHQDSFTSLRGYCTSGPYF